MISKLAASLASLSFCLLVAGCASSTAAGGGHGHDHDHEHGPDGHHHPPKLEGGMKAFHDVLAPPYHMEKGAPRNDAACTNVPAMKDAATKIAAEPKGDAAAWKTKSDNLARSVGEMETACGVAGKADVPAKLETVHDGFHALMEAGH